MSSNLKGKIFAITRNEQDSKEFSQLVSTQGGRTLPLPTIEVNPLGQEAVQQFIDRLQSKRYDYCTFMSSQAVKVLFDLANKQQITAALNSTEIIAIGPKTKQSLEQRGVKVKRIPEKFSSIGLVDMMAKLEPAGKMMIIPRSSAANDFVVESLLDLGMKVDEVHLYELRTSRPTDVWFEFYKLLQMKKINAIVFTSASSVASFFDISVILKVEGKEEGQQQQWRIDSLTKIISIGPLTSKELEKRKIKPYEAEEHTIKGTFNLALDLCANKE